MQYGNNIQVHMALSAAHAGCKADTDNILIIEVQCCPSTTADGLMLLCHMRCIQH